MPKTIIYCIVGSLVCLVAIIFIALVLIKIKKKRLLYCNCLSFFNCNTRQQQNGTGKKSEGGDFYEQPVDNDMNENEKRLPSDNDYVYADSYKLSSLARNAISENPNIAVNIHQGNSSPPPPPPVDYPQDPSSEITNSSFQGEAAGNNSKRYQDPNQENDEESDYINFSKNGINSEQTYNVLEEPNLGAPEYLELQNPVDYVYCPLENPAPNGYQESFGEHHSGTFRSPQDENDDEDDEEIYGVFKKENRSESSSPGEDENISECGNLESVPNVHAPSEDQNYGNATFENEEEIYEVFRKETPGGYGSFANENLREYDPVENKKKHKYVNIENYGPGAYNPSQEHPFKCGPLVESPSENSSSNIDYDACYCSQNKDSSKYGTLQNDPTHVYGSLETDHEDPHVYSALSNQEQNIYNYNADKQWYQNIGNEEDPEQCGSYENNFEQCTGNDPGALNYGYQEEYRNRVPQGTSNYDNSMQEIENHENFTDQLHVNLNELNV